MNKSAFFGAALVLTCACGEGLAGETTPGAAEALPGQDDAPVGVPDDQGPVPDDEVRVPDDQIPVPDDQGPVPDFVSTLPPLAPGEPIDAAFHEWSWIDVPEAVCQRNDRTGMHFNLGDPDRLVILMEGGGACFNSTSCTLSYAIHPFGASALDTPLITEVYGNNIFDRNDPNNPLRTWSYVFFPYCSGDVFAGASKITEGFEGRSQQGYYNVQAYLKRLIATFPDASKVLLTGVSAGGFGAGFNFDQVQEAFGQRTRVYLIDDSGPPLPPEVMSPCLQKRWRKEWSLDTIMPPPEACPGCRNAETDVGVMGMVEYLAKKYRNRRFAVISATHDLVIREFFGFGLDGCKHLDQPFGLPFLATPIAEDDYAAGLRALLDYTRNIPNGGSMRGFLIPDSLMHTALVVPGALENTIVDGVSLGTWLRQFVEDDPAWDHVGVH